MIVISNTTPITYLVRIGLVDILRELYGNVIIPQAVFTELQREETPEVVRVWVQNCPAWFQVKAVHIPDTLPMKLHRGEREAILLAKEEKADAVIIDEKKGREAAENEGIRVIGTLRILYDASELGLCDLEEAFDRMRRTSFHAADSLYQHFLELKKKG